MAASIEDRDDLVSVALAARADAACRIRDILDRVGEKWTLAVADQLRKGPRRFTELRRGAPGISQRMLTSTLRGLERDGLVTRTVYPVVPPRVDYELTPLGQELLEMVWPLLNWTLAHADDIDKSREAYDRNEGAW